MIAWVIHVNWPESHKTVRKDRWTHAYGQQPNIPKIRDMGFSRLTFEVERFTINKVKNQVPYFFIPTCDRGRLLFQYLSNIQFQYSAQLKGVCVALAVYSRSYSVAIYSSSFSLTCCRLSDMLSSFSWKALASLVPLGNSSFAGGDEEFVLQWVLFRTLMHQELGMCVGRPLCKRSWLALVYCCREEVTK